MKETDVLIIGGGIVGLATAHQLLKDDRSRSVTILEKEAELGHHQTGHNSGVLHSGIYYKPGSLKAKNCREGKKAMEKFCKAEGIDFDVCGKVIVATNTDELPAMHRIHERGQANGVKCQVVDKARLAELEPHANGVAALHVPEAGIVNYRQVCDRLAEKIEKAGGEILTNSKVCFITGSRPITIVQTKSGGEFHAKWVVNCAGLHSDRITDMGGQKPDAKIVPFRGEYYELKPEAHELCRNLIYPVPDPSFPFLGVHFTRMIEGGVECGPNAVLAFAREGYTKLKVNLEDLVESLTYPGFIKLALKYWKTGAGEMWRSFSKHAFVKALQRLVPEIEARHLVKAPAGVRAQAVAQDGSMVDDFLIQRNGPIINVGNAPSPAATASLNIGKHIASLIS